MLTKMSIIRVHRRFLSFLGSTLRGIHSDGNLPGTQLRRLSFSLGSHMSRNKAYTLAVSHEVQIPVRKSVLGCQCRWYSKSVEKSATQEEEVDQDCKDDDENRKDETSEEYNSQDEDEYNEEGETLQLTDGQIEYLTKGDENLKKKVQFIILEHSVLKQEGEQVPSTIQLKHWEELLMLDSRSKRKRYYLYLFKIEMKNLSAKRKRMEKQEERLKVYAENPLPSREEDIYGVAYALSRNCLHLRCYDTTINRLFNGRACSAMVLHPPLILDCSYDEHMTYREAKNCAKQLELVIADNRTHAEPYNLYLCNAGKDTNTMRYLRRMIPIIDNDDFVVNIHEEDILDLFPKDRLVYLTPHTRDELVEYNEDDIYIIGAMIDRTNPRPYSLAKAKKMGVRMRRLPLDRHLMWGLGGKSLTLNQMAKIMLDVRYTRGNWKEALKHVPMRKLDRQFHPYPDQIEQNQSPDLSGPNMQPLGQERWMAPRHEKRSLVYEDYELLNRRKGFQRSVGYTPRPDRVRAPKMKSLLYDDDEQ